MATMPWKREGAEAWPRSSISTTFARRRKRLKKIPSRHETVSAMAAARMTESVTGKMKTAGNKTLTARFWLAIARMIIRVTTNLFSRLLKNL